MPRLARGSSISYWVIAPEVETDAVVGALRRSWLAGAGADAHYCTARSISESSDASLHWLEGLNRSTHVASGRNDLNELLQRSVFAAPAAPPPLPPPPPQLRGASATLRPATVGASRGPRATKPAAAARAAAARELTRRYNNFLRHKVFAIMRQMCIAHGERRLGFALLMDADTAVNRSNLERYVSRIDPRTRVYTGLCKRHASVGGGPGILLSGGLLDSVCPRLESCGPLRDLMDRLEFAGGDLMLAKCFEFLGLKCQMPEELVARDLSWSTSSTPSRTARGPGHVDNSPMVEDLFRRGPPWVYPPLEHGTILIATRRSVGVRAIDQYRRLTKSGLPLSQVVTYHHVKPTHRTRSWGKDARCRVLAEYTRLASGPAHWSSRCLPAFLLLGTPKSGTTSLFNWLLQHPDMKPPSRKELHYWAPVISPDKACLDRPECAAIAARVPSLSPGANRSAEGSPQHTTAQQHTSAPQQAGKAPQHTEKAWPLSKGVAGRITVSYLDSGFPRIDPRDFAISGEASPAYIYSPSVAMLLESSLMAHAKMLVLLRDPAERAFSEYKNKRDLMLTGGKAAHLWLGGHAKFADFVAELRAATDGCTPRELYAACVACARFAQAPGAVDPDRSGADGGNRGGGAAAGGNRGGGGAAAGKIVSSFGGRCVVPPVVWQSWYHLFLPRLMRGGMGPRLLIEFSDDLFDAPDEVTRRVASFVGLHPPHNFSTAVAYNTEGRRGAYIAGQPISAVRGTKANEQDAASASRGRSSALDDEMAVLRQLMRHSVRSLAGLLAAPSWRAPPSQKRRALPPRWVQPYS